MTVLPPRAPAEDLGPQGAPAPPADRPVAPEPGVASRPAGGPRISPERIVLGVLLAAAGAAWLLDVAGVSVPWALAPAVAVVVIGVALILAARTPGGHAPLVIWGAVLLVVAIAVAVVRPVGGPIGDRVVTPTASQWPVATSLTAGNLTVDLRQNPLPARGRLTADVTAGTVVLRLPDAVPAERVHVVAHVGTGQILVDGNVQRSGMGLDWTSPDPAAVVVDVHVGTGQVEVNHG